MNSVNRNFLFVYIFVANLLDALMTHYSVSTGLAWEVNPLMRYLLETSSFYFYACKISLVTLGLALLARLGETRGTAIALCFCCVIYTLVLFMHAGIFLQEII